jgi:membrane protease YdiL (CAAX protease family)
VTQDPPPISRTPDVLLVALAMTLPTVMAWFYFHALGGSGRLNPLQQLGYAGGKVLQFSIPILFIFFVARRWPEVKGPTTEGMLLGLGFGLVVFLAIVGAYFSGLNSSSLLAGAAGRVRAKMEEFGVASPAGFLALAVFLCAAHSFLEEYYWRWYVFGRLRTMLPVVSAVVVSSLGFMAHHVLILYAYLPDRLLTGVLPASLGVAVGGAVWAALYQRAGSLAAPWLSHALVDAALFVVGWDMLRQAG